MAEKDKETTFVGKSDQERILKGPELEKQKLANVSSSGLRFKQQPLKASS